MLLLYYSHHLPTPPQTKHHFVVGGRTKIKGGLTSERFSPCLQKNVPNQNPELEIFNLPLFLKVVKSKPWKPWESTIVNWFANFSIQFQNSKFRIVIWHISWRWKQFSEIKPPLVVPIRCSSIYLKVAISCVR